MMEKWSNEIKPKRSLFDLKLRDLWEYRDLLLMFVRKDVVTIYKQTILGPLWFFIQPILTTLVYVFVFGKIAGLSSDGLPRILFYMSGVVMWNYFAECFNQTSSTFSQNAQIFGKVYFPRLIIPLSKIISALIKFCIQIILFLVFYLYYLVNGDLDPNISILLLPFLIFLMAGIGLGLGLIFTSLTTKYRDLKFLIQFGVQLAMYATPIIYPLNAVQGKMRIMMEWNPFAHIIEAFKYGFMGTGQLSSFGLIYSFIFMILFLFLGIVIFNKTEQKFMDTV